MAQKLDKASQATPPSSSSAKKPTYRKRPTTMTILAHRGYAGSGAGEHDSFIGFKWSQNSCAMDSLLEVLFAHFVREPAF